MFSTCGRVVCLSFVCRLSVVCLSFVCRLSVVCLSFVCRLSVVCLSFACRLQGRRGALQGGVLPSVGKTALQRDITPEQRPAGLD